LGELSLFLNKKEEKELNLKVEIEITKGYEAFRWKTSNESKFSSENFQPMFRENDSSDGNDDASSFNYLFNHENLFIKSHYIELNSEVMNGLMNSNLLFRIVNADAVAAAGGDAAKKDDKKGGKGGPAAVAPPTTVESLVEISIPFYALTLVKGGVLEINNQTAFSQLASAFPFFPSAPTSFPSVNSDQSNWNIKVIMDSCMGEYLLGSRIIQWKSASFSNFPSSWTLHAPDVADPKAKVQPSVQDLRTKYLENIVKNVANQGKIASYTVTVGGGNGGEEEADNIVAQLSQLFPIMSLTNGKIEFDETQAAEVSMDEDIRNRVDLWKGTPFVSACFALFSLISLSFSVCSDLGCFVKYLSSSFTMSSISIFD
jgi:hypothetical protein